jgi:FkbM family methyltransferase
MRTYGPFVSKIIDSVAIPEQAFWRSCPKTIEAGREWEPITNRLIVEVLREGGSLVQAGAFFGDGITKIAEGLQKDQRIFLYEPCHINIYSLLKTLELGRVSYENVSLFPLALSSSPGVAHLRTVERASTGRFLGGGSRIVTQDLNTYPVATTTIDLTVPSNIKVSCIHLDVEDYQLEALLGAKRVISSWRPSLVVEGKLPDSFLSDYGYKEEASAVIAENNRLYLAH